MQLLILVKKDIMSLFQQKAIWIALLIPMFFITSFGLIPTLLGVEGPFEVYYLNEDEGIEGMNLGLSIITELEIVVNEAENLELIPVYSFEEFVEKENGIRFLHNFTYTANLTRVALYYIKILETSIRAHSIMNNVIATLIEKVVREELLFPDIPPTVVSERVYQDFDLYDKEERERRINIAFPLAYMTLLILILAGSSMRITGFTSEKQSGMMELLLSSVVHRRELVLSKLITGVIYGFISVASYMIGFVFVFLFENEEASEGTEFSALIFPKEEITVLNVFIITILFSVLTLLSMQIILASQLVMGKDVGDRIGSMINMGFAFLFYFGTYGDSLSETPLQMVNPFFWPFKIALNLIFHDNLVRIFIYIFTILIFSSVMLKIKTLAIEREKTLYE